MQLLGELAALWRYPVKSLAAEPLERALLQADGIPGDRTSALFVESGHARAGKTYRGKENNLLHTAAEPGPAIAAALESGVRVAVRGRPGARYFDAAPISLIFDRWIGEVERALRTPLNPLRWRPNLFVRAAADFTLAESDLLGASISLGQSVLRVRDTIKRCVTTTYDVHTGERNDDVLFHVAQQREAVMGVYCEVELAGTVRVGDALRLRDR